MQIPPKHTHIVSLAEASNYTANFRKSDRNTGVCGGMFWKEAITKLISQPDCAGVRYYYAEQDNGTPALVMVGVDHEGKDMITGVLLEESWICPPYCSEVNLLNSGVSQGKWRPDRKPEIVNSPVENHEQASRV